MRMIAIEVEMKLDKGRSDWLILNLTSVGGSHLSNLLQDSHT